VSPEIPVALGGDAGGEGKWWPWVNQGDPQVVHLLEKVGGSNTRDASAANEDIKLAGGGGGGEGG